MAALNHGSRRLIVSAAEAAALREHRLRYLIRPVRPSVPGCDLVSGTLHGVRRPLLHRKDGRLFHAPVRLPYPTHVDLPVYAPCGGEPAARLPRQTAYPHCRIGDAKLQRLSDVAEVALRGSAAVAAREELPARELRARLRDQLRLPRDADPWVWVMRFDR